MTSLLTKSYKALSTLRSPRLTVAGIAQILGLGQRPMLRALRPQIKAWTAVSLRDMQKKGTQMRHGIVLVACALAQLASLRAHADWVIEHVTLIDGIHEPQADMTVAIEGDRITAIAPSAVARGLKGRRIAGNG